MKGGDNVKIWTGFSDVDRAVDTIAKIKTTTGRVPAALLDAYRGTLKTTTRGMVQRFFEVLADQCPECLSEFTDEDEDGGKVVAV